MTLLRSWTDRDVERAVRAGLWCGLAAALTYLAWSFVPLPPRLNTLFHVFFGLLVVPGFLAVGIRVQDAGASVAALFGTLFGMIAGPFFAAMTIVQVANLTYLRRFIRESQGAAKERYEEILRGVFTVQLGLDLVWDLFVTCATILIGFAMLKVPGVRRVLGLLGIAAGALTLGLNLWTMPVPPAEAGLFDAGPAVGAWYLVVSAWMLWSSGSGGSGPVLRPG